jgi:hypothetical protein
MSIFKISFSIPSLFLLTTVISNNSTRLSRIHTSISGKDHHKPKALTSHCLLAAVYKSSNYSDINRTSLFVEVLWFRAEHLEVMAGCLFSSSGPESYQ